MADPHSQGYEFFETTMCLLAKPWTGHILLTLQEGPLRFNEMATRVEGIGEKVLSARLKELESLGLLARHVFPTTPVRVEYELTPKGRGFEEVANAVNLWGELIARTTSTSAR